MCLDAVTTYSELLQIHDHLKSRCQFYLFSFYLVCYVAKCSLSDDSLSYTRHEDKLGVTTSHYYKNASLQLENIV